MCSWREPDWFEDRPALPEFPIEVLPDSLQQFVRVVSDAVHTPYDLAGAVALGAVSAVTGGHLDVEVKAGYRQPTNLYLCVVVPSGGGKSPVFSKGIKPLIEVEKELIEMHKKRVVADRARAMVLDRERKEQLRIFNSGEAGSLAAADRVVALDQELAEIDGAQPPRLLADDVTAEALEGLMARNGGRVAIYSAETTLFGSLLGDRFNRNPKVESFLSAHSAEPIRCDRRGRGAEVIERPALTIVSATQPETLRGIRHNRENYDRGILARFLWVLPDCKIGYRDVRLRSISERELCPYHELILGIARTLVFPQARLTLRFSEPAVDRFQAWLASTEERKRPDGSLAPLGSWAHKLESQVIRLAGLLAAADDPALESREISVATLERAFVLGEYFVAHAAAALDAVEVTRPAAIGERLLGWIRAAGVQRFSRRDCARRNQWAKTEALKVGLSELEQRGMIRGREVTRERGGTPSRMYEVNPAVVTVVSHSEGASE